MEMHIPISSYPLGKLLPSVKRTTRAARQRSAKGKRKLAKIREGGRLAQTCVFHSAPPQAEPYKCHSIMDLYPIRFLKITTQCCCHSRGLMTYFHWANYRFTPSGESTKSASLHCPLTRFCFSLLPMCLASEMYGVGGKQMLFQAMCR